MTEIDLDAFGGGNVVELEPEPQVDPRLEEAVRSAQAEHVSHSQLTMEGGEVPVRAGTEQYIMAIVFASRSGGRGHIVSVVERHGGGKAVACTCEAMRNLDRRPRGCWAMQLTRRITGIELLEVE